MLKKISKFIFSFVTLSAISGALLFQIVYAQGTDLSTTPPAPPPTYAPSASVSSNGQPTSDTYLPTFSGGPGGTANNSPSEINTVSNLAHATGTINTTWQSIVTRLIQMALAISGTLAFISFTVAGVMMVTARGNEEQIGKGKHILIWSILALTVIATSYAVVYGISLLNFSATQ